MRSEPHPPHTHSWPFICCHLWSHPSAPVTGNCQMKSEIKIGVAWVVTLCGWFQVPACLTAPTLGLTSPSLLGLSHPTVLWPLAHACFFASKCLPHLHLLTRSFALTVGFWLKLPFPRFLAPILPSFWDPSLPSSMQFSQQPWASNGFSCLLCTNSHSEALTSDMMVFGDWPFGRSAFG